MTNPSPRHRRREVLLWIAVAMTSGCQRSEGTDRTLALAQAVAAVAPGQVLALDQAVPAAWDRVMLVGPYTPQADIRAAAGGRLPPEVERIGIQQRDDVNMLVFLRAGEDGLALALERRVADFDKADLMRPMARAQARLVRAGTGVGFRWQTP